MVEFETSKSTKSCLKEKQQIFSDVGYRIEKMLQGIKLSERNYDMGSYRIYVGFIPKSFTEKDLRENFQRFGKIDEAYINRQVRVVEWMSVSSHFGFVTFSDASVTKYLV